MNEKQSNIAEIARQSEYRRNLENARRTQQEKEQAAKSAYNEKIGTSVQNANLPSVDQKSVEREKKNQLTQRRQDENKKTADKKQKKAYNLLVKKQQKIIKKYEGTSWFLLYVAAFSDDIFDVLTIPVVSTIGSFCTSLYVNGKLWSMGSEKARNQMRMKRAGLLVVDLIPIINWIPITTWIVYKAQQNEQKRVKRAKKIIAKYSQT